MSRYFSAILLAASVSCAAPFPAINLVDSPRILLIAPSPTAVLPGETMTAQLLIAGGEVTVSKWRVCVPLKIDPAPEQRCLDGQGLIAFNQTGGDTLRWPVTSDENELGRFVIGANVDERGNIPQPARLLTEVQTNGLEVLIYVEGTAGTTTVRAFKRALLLIRPMRETVAIVPAFQFGSQTLEPSVNHECVVRGDPMSTITLPARSTNSIVPAIAPMTTLQETLSHYANSGDFPERPDRPDLARWIAPAAGSMVDHWLVSQRNIPRSQGNRVSVMNWCHFRVFVQ